MNRKTSIALALAICGLLIAMAIPVANAVQPRYPTGEDVIWVVDGPRLLCDEGLHVCIYTKMGVYSLGPQSDEHYGLDSGLGWTTAKLCEGIAQRSMDSSPKLPKPWLYRVFLLC